MSLIISRIWSILLGLWGYPRGWHCWWTRTSCIVYGIQSGSHCLSKAFCVLLVGKIQTINLTLVSPLMKCGRGLVIFQTTNDCTVNDHLMVLQLPAHNPECIIGRVAINLDLGEALCCTACHPFLGGIII